MSTIFCSSTSSSWLSGATGGFSDDGSDISTEVVFISFESISFNKKNEDQIYCCFDMFRSTKEQLLLDLLDFTVMRIIVMNRTKNLTNVFEADVSR